MPIRIYHDFILFTYEVQEDAHGGIASFKVRVFDSPVGQGEEEDPVLIPDYEQLKEQSRRLETRALDRQLPAQMALGARLGELLLPPRSRALLERSLAWLQQHEDEGLRLRLRLEGALADLPWEFIYLDKAGDGSSPSGFIALNPRISIVRHEALALRAVELVAGESPAVPAEWLPPPEAAEKRRVVVAMATPQPYRDYPPLRELPAEQTQIKSALRQVRGIDPIYLPEYHDPEDYQRVSGATLTALKDALGQTADIFHFSGHGEFEKRLGPGGDSIIGEGWLILAQPDNQADRVSAEELRALLDEREVRLVVLGACESARRDRFQKLSSVAVSFLKGRVPCVVAMQFTIADHLAASFMGAFYEALVAGLQIDEAVALGRAMIWSATHGDGSHRRDWGVPVLYLRTPGGRIFPPVTDEAARQEAERRSRERFDLNRAWWEWIASDAVATEAQLAHLAAAEALRLSPSQALLLLRSSVIRDVTPLPWISHLRDLRAGTPPTWESSEGDATTPWTEARAIVGLDDPGLPERPAGMDPLAWAAAHHPQAETRQTAALALDALEAEPRAALDKLEATLRWLDGRTRQSRRAELRGALADADPAIARLNAALPPWQRFGVWLWRVGRRVRRDWRWIRALLVGGALGAGLGLGLLRLALAILPEIVQPRSVLPGVQFAIYSFWGGILGFCVCLGMLLTDALQLQRLAAIEQNTGRGPSRWLLAVALGTISGGGALLLLAWLGGLKIIGRPLVAPLGFLFSLGFSIALYGQPAASVRQGMQRALRLAAIAAAAAVLTQLVFIMAKDLGLAIAIAWPSSRYTAYYTTFIKAVWRTLPKAVPDWATCLGLLDAALVGIVLTLGTALGLNLAAERLRQAEPAHEL